MSVKSVKQDIGRATAEPEYRELLFNDADKALEGLDLTEEELDALKLLKRETFDSAAGELPERISRAGFQLLSTSQAGEELEKGKKSKTFEKPGSQDICQ